MFIRRIWILLAFALVACNPQAIASKQDKGSRPPAWINGESIDYPNSNYLTASGSASSAEVAKNRALANLSKIFEAKIKAESNTLSDVKTQVTNGKENYTKDTRVVQNISVATDKVLDGVRIAETWLDSSVQEYHALAVLERSQAGRNIRQQIGELDQSTETELARAAAASDKLLAMAALNQAYQLQFNRQALQRTLKVIDLKGVGKPSQWNLADLRGQLENNLLSLKIAADIEDDATGNLKRLVRGAMSQAGFPAVNGVADFSIKANLQTTDVGLRQGWYWMRGKVNIKLVEAATGKVRGTHTWELKVSANSRDVAMSRLISKAD